MRNKIKATVTETREFVALVRIHCSECCKHIGDFASHEPVACGVTQRIPDSKTEWYTVTKIQEYDKRSEWGPDDVCPNCLPTYIRKFVDRHRGADDLMELHIEHKIASQAVVTDEFLNQLKKTHKDAVFLEDVNEQYETKLPPEDEECNTQENSDEHEESCLFTKGEYDNE